MVIRLNDLILRIKDAKIDLKSRFNNFGNQVARSKIDNDESKNHGAQISGHPLENPGCKN